MFPRILCLAEPFGKNGHSAVVSSCYGYISNVSELLQAPFPNGQCRGKFAKISRQSCFTINRSPGGFSPIMSHFQENSV